MNIKYLPTVAILMATYNGSRFLSEQINSIINQSYKNWILYICDDNSNDSTVEIISKFIDKDPRIKRVTFHEKKQGAKYTFSYLLNSVESEYYMFSDQDDVWLPDKIELSINHILSIETRNPNMPIVIHTDLEVVDQNLHTIHSSFWKSSKIKPSILNNFNYIGICNCATGCTMIFNSSAKKVSLPIPDDIDMHDWWITLITSKYGKIDFINKTTILYRQHASNVVGARDINKKYFIKKIRNLTNTIKGHKTQYEFLKLAKWGNWMKFYLYKVLYTYKRNLR